MRKSYIFLFLFFFAGQVWAEHFKAKDIEDIFARVDGKKLGLALSAAHTKGFAGEYEKKVGELGFEKCHKVVAWLGTMAASEYEPLRNLAYHIIRSYFDEKRRGLLKYLTGIGWAGTDKKGNDLEQKIYTAVMCDLEKDQGSFYRNLSWADKGFALIGVGKLQSLLTKRCGLLGDGSGKLMPDMPHPLPPIYSPNPHHPIKPMDRLRAWLIRWDMATYLDKGGKIPESRKFKEKFLTGGEARKAKIGVVDAYIQDLVKKYARSSQKIAIHNFANACQLGGGTLNGRVAQEESLMRAMPEVMLSYLKVGGKRGEDVFLSPGEVYITPGTGEHENITVLAAALPWLVENPLAVTDFEGTALSYMPDTLGLAKADWPVYGRKILDKGSYARCLREAILSVLKAAKSEGVDVLITGAWGSGVYNHPPEVVAEMFHKLLDEDDGTGKKLWKENFDHIIFAIPDKTSPNYNAYTKFFPEETLTLAS